jgi:hypothetical protein
LLQQSISRGAGGGGAGVRILTHREARGRAIFDPVLGVRVGAPEYIPIANGCRVVPYHRHRLGVKLNSSEAAILDSVWSAFVKVAAEFPDHKDVVMTLQYHGWYSRQCNILSQRSESPTP